MLPVVTSLAVVFGLAAPQTAIQCAANGPGGFVPGAGASDGIWPLVLPGGSLVSTQAVSAPVAGHVIRSVRIALKHTYASDVQLVLIDPNGAAYNVLQWNDGVAVGNCSADFFGIYDFVDPVASASCNGVPALTCNANQLAPGTYRQSFGAWPSGASGVANIPLEQIPVTAGNWSLVIHDWFASADNGALLSWELCFGTPSPLPPPPQNAPQCGASASGGSFPSGGTSGSWPSTLPSAPFSAPLAVSVPAGATQVAAVRVQALAHQWIGDVQFVLEAPSGVRYNLVQTNDGLPGGGCSDEFNGTYTFVDPLSGTDPCGVLAQPVGCGLSTLPEGTYAQTFGNWPSGTHGIVNVPLSQIPLASGTWILRAYDWWVPADSGSFASWSVCFSSSATPTTFCTPQFPGTTNGCYATISASEQPSLSSTTSCLLSLAHVEGGKTGLFFYGTQGRTSSPWCSTSSNLLCVKPPTQRTSAFDTGGTDGACNGSLALDFGTWCATHPGTVGSPWSAGAKAWVQGWFRDPPACKTTSLSEGIELTWQP
ncbi:MAG: hypothetical protein FJ294_12295 [Planctomycetes bacterium]|nr:hypothetical protein [Planctomycetota bacterium]